MEAADLLLTRQIPLILLALLGYGCFCHFRFGIRAKHGGGSWLAFSSIPVPGAGVSAPPIRAGRYSFHSRWIMEQARKIWAPIGSPGALLVKSLASLRVVALTRPYTPQQNIACQWPFLHRVYLNSRKTLATDGAPLMRAVRRTASVIAQNAGRNREPESRRVPLENPSFESYIAARILSHPVATTTP